MTHREFFERVRELAAGVPGLSPEGTAAHAANESGYGISQLALIHNNLWGIKATGSWQGATIKLPTWEVVNGVRIETSAVWRAYDDWRHCIEDYGDIIRRLYPFAAKNAGNPTSFLAGLFLVGPYKWATDPNAFHKALGILDAFGHAGAAPEENVQRLGEHELWVDNTPSLGKGITMITAALTSRPAVFAEPVRATRTKRQGGWKLDLARNE